jgi:FkbM family methyltransferase
MIENIYEHSVRTDILTPGGWVIDFGCGVDFNFSKKMVEMGMKVISVDPNPRITSTPNIDNLFYERMALVVDDTIESIDLDIFNDTDAASTIKTNNDIGFVSKQNTISVEATTIKKLMDKYQIEKLDVLKLDIEGAEYSVLMSIDSEIANQISIEFHDFRGMNPNYPNNELYYDQLKEKLGNMYSFVKHEKEQHRGIPGHLGLNYWDSLLVSKKF